MPTAGKTEKTYTLQQHLRDVRPSTIHVCGFNKGTFLWFAQLPTFYFRFCIFSVLVAGRNQLRFVSHITYTMLAGM